MERIRANLAGFANGDYAKTSSYNGSFNEIAAVPCTYPLCTSTSLAAMDMAATQREARLELPAGGMLTTSPPPTPCTQESYGNVWIMWRGLHQRGADPRLHRQLPRRPSPAWIRLRAAFMSGSSQVTSRASVWRAAALAV